MKFSIININFNNREGLQKTIDGVVAQTLSLIKTGLGMLKSIFFDIDGFLEFEGSVG